MQEPITEKIRSNVLRTQNLARQLRHSSPGKNANLHDFRVGLRKVQASASILKCVKEQEDIAATLGQVKKLLKATNQVRDAEVLQQILRHGKLKPPASLNEPKQELPAILEKNSLNKLKEHAELIEDPKFNKKTKKMVKKHTKTIRSMAKKLKKHRDDPSFLHHYRIRAKKLRYILDVLDPALKPETKKLKSYLKKNQKAFGKIHDYDRAVEILKSPALAFHQHERKALLKQVKKDRKKLIKPALKRGKQLAKHLS